MTNKPNLTLVSSRSPKTMSSLEIADLCGKQHKNVIRDIENMFQELGLAASKSELGPNENAKSSKLKTEPGDFPFQSTYLDANKQARKCYNLPRRECDILVSGYNIKYRTAIVDRWIELEKAAAAPVFNIPQTFSEAMQLAADQAKQLEEQAPKVAVYELLADRRRDVSTTVVAKQLGITAIKLNKFLRENGVKWLYDDMPKAGYEPWFNVVSDSKNGHEFTQCVVTPLGQIEIAKLWGKSLRSENY